MAVPKKKTSVRRKGLRRGGHTHKLRANAPTMRCPECQSLSLKHRICPSCGHYRGRSIVAIPPSDGDGEGAPEEKADESR